MAQDTKQYLGVRASHTNSYQGLLTAFKWLPNPDLVLKKNNKDISAYHDIRHDPHVYSCLQSRKAGVLSLEWGVNVGKEQTEASLFIEKTLRDLNLHRVMSGILEAIGYGYQPLEIYWREEQGRLVVKDIIAKPPEWFCFDTNQRLLFRSKQKIDGENCHAFKFVVAQNNPSYVNPYGEALLSKCFWAVTFKKNAMRFWLRFAEKYGFPYLHGTTPISPTTDDAEELKEALEEMRQDGVIVTDAETQVSLLDASGTASATLFQSLIAHCNAEITRVILSHAGTTEATPGKLGNDTLATEVRQQVMDADKRLVEQTMNTIVRLIVEANFDASVEIPTFTLFEEQDLERQRAERDKILADMKLFKFTKEYFVNHYNFKETEIELLPDQTAQAGAFEEPHSHHHAESKENATAEQRSVDGATESFALETDGAVQEMIAPAIAMIRSGSDYEEVSVALRKMYGKLDTETIEQVMERAIFVAEATGRLSASAEGA